MSLKLYESATTRTLPVAGEPLELTYAHLPCTAGQTGLQFLLLHGNPSHLGHWHAMVPMLRELGDVCAIDMPGFGRSQTPGDKVMSLDRLADASLAIADAVGFEKLVPVGNSFGGGVAQTLAARYPDRVKAVVLVATIGTPANPTIKATFLPFAEPVSSFVAHRMVRWPFRSLAAKWAVINARMNCSPDPVPEGFAEADFEMVAARPEIQGNSVRACVDDPTLQLVAQAGKIRVPVLMVHPADDRVVPMFYAENLRKVLQDHGVDVTLKTVPGGHLAHLAHPAEVNAEIRQWVQAKFPARP
ncbi:MAG: alpha/beta hydrolase [Archangiaceae bacterium]|nr:alpha/beta hydrolase [Archangiaceae bacterium]